MNNPGRMVAFSDGQQPSLTYEPFFGLREKPFSLAADPRFLYTGPSHARAFDKLLAGIKRREGLIVLSGEIGTGKTTLCRSVLGQLDRRTFSTFVRDPFLSREDLLKTLLIDFGVMSVADLKSGRLNGATRPDLSYPLYEFLDSLVPLQAFAVLIVDEAQNLSPSLLEEIRILSELEAREKLLQVVLVGQPELKASLKLPELRQVDQRVSVRCELSPLDRADVGEYIEHRLRVASGGPPSVEFTADAVEAVWLASRGVPRLINQVCDRTLHVAFDERDPAVTRTHVERAVVELDYRLDAGDACAVVAPDGIAGDSTTSAVRPDEDALANSDLRTFRAPSSTCPVACDRSAAFPSPSVDALSEFGTEPGGSSPVLPDVALLVPERRTWVGVSAVVLAMAAAAGVFAYLEVRAATTAAAMAPALPPPPVIWNPERAVPRPAGDISRPLSQVRD